MKQKSAKHFWRRSLSMGLSMAMAVTLFPSAQLWAGDTSGEGTEAVGTIVKAGSIADAGTTTGQPFVADSTGGSKYFGAPSFTVVETYGEGDDGETVVESSKLIAAADVKYDTTGNAGGLDIIVSTANRTAASGIWSYSFPFYFPDSAGFSKDATTVNNSVLVTGNDGTIYCLANVNPAGVSAMEDGFTYPNKGTGFINIGSESDEDWRLALTDDDSKLNTAPDDKSNGYKYYVGEAANGFMPIMEIGQNGNTATDYAVDAWYNLFKKNSSGVYETVMQKQLDTEKEVQSNVFYKDSAFHVYNTGYLMCVTSADGNTWSEPEILNPYVKSEDEAALIISSGKGLCTTPGRIVIPVYTRSNEDGVPSRASLIWCDMTSNSSATYGEWYRSDDVPLVTYTDEETQEEVSYGATESEVIELSNGHLRMFLQSESGTISYADARRVSESDNPDKFTFNFTDDDGNANSVVATTAGAGANQSLSAIRYRNKINGKNAVLVSAPDATTDMSGRIYTFLADTSADDWGDIDDSGAMTWQYDYAVTTSSTFKDSCIEQMNDGSQIGMLWENGVGSVRYQTFNILDLVEDSDGQTAYIPDIEVDITLEEGATYERRYNVYDLENIETRTEEEVAEQCSTDVIGVSFKKGKTETSTVPALYKMKATNASTLENAFEATASNLDIRDAEFTITSPSNQAEGQYIVYNERRKRYFVIGGAAAVTLPNDFAANLSSYVAIYQDERNQTENRYTYNIVRGDITNNNADIRIFCGLTSKLEWSSGHTTFGHNNYKSWISGSNTDVNCEFVFLEKVTESLGDSDINMASVDVGDQIITGYKLVDKIVSGKKYLIGQIWTGDRSGNFTDANTTPVRILYPRNGTTNEMCLAYGTHEVTTMAEKTLTITGKKSGTAQLTLNGVTYNITVGELERDPIMEGGSRFVEGIKAKDVIIEDSSIISVEDYVGKKNALFSYNTSGKGGMTYYNLTQPDYDVEFEDAEFVITERSDSTDTAKKYDIYNEAKGLYLVNLNARQYFSNQNNRPQTLEAVTDDDGNTSFEISSQGTNDTSQIRYCIFYYDDMNLNANETKNNIREVDENRYDYGLELLEKQDNVSDTDPIPGYIRVDKITSGKTYLITEFYIENGKQYIIVLYPISGNNEANKANQSKAFATVDVEGVMVDALGEAGESTYVTIDGVKYKIRIVENDCEHDLGVTLRHYQAATCEADGYTGEYRCNRCGAALLDLDDLNVADKTVGTQQTITKGHLWTVNGTRGSADEGWEQTSEATEEADAVESRTCIDCGEEEPRIVAGSSLKVAVDNLKKAYDTAKSKYDEIKDSADDYIQSTFNELKNAVDEAKGLLDSYEAGTLTDEDKEDVIDSKTRVTDAFNNLATNEELEEAKGDLSGSISKALSILQSKDDYPGDAITALESAIDSIKDNYGIDIKTITENDMDDIEISDLRGAYSDLSAALADIKSYVEQLIENIQKLIDDEGAEAIYATNGEGYTSESWAAFKTAYEAVNLDADALKSLGKETLQDYYNDLKDAIDGLEEKNGEENPGGDPGTNPGGDPGTDPGTKPGTKPGTNPGTNTGTNPNGVVLTANKTVTLDSGTYQVTNAANKEVTIIKGTNIKKVAIPATVLVDGIECKVVGIGSSAFKGYKNVKTVVIGANVTSIGAQAFSGCTKMTKVTIGAGVKSIGKKAFFKCTKLKSVILNGKSAPSIGKQSFKKTAAKVTVKASKIKKAQRKKLLKKLKSAGKMSKKSVVK